MASAQNNVTVGAEPSAGTQLLDKRDECSGFLVRCRDDSANAALVRAEGLHRPGEFLRVPVGHELTLHAPVNEMRAVYAKGEAGEASIDCGVVDR